MIKDFVPLAGLNDLVFGGWDIFEDNCLRSRRQRQGAGARRCSSSCKEPLSAIKPMKAVFDQEYVKRINGPNVKAKGTKMDKAEMLMEDIRNFSETNGAARLVMIWCGSTEVFHKPAAVHQTLEGFRMRAAEERSRDRAQPDLRLRRAEDRACRSPTARRNLTIDTPALLELARERKCPDLRQGFQDRPDLHEDADRARA